MLVERPVKEALKDYLKGKKVVVIMEYPDGSTELMKMEDILTQENSHYLVDVPAVMNPDFEAAVQDMIKGSEMIASEEDTADQREIESKTDESDSMKSQEKELPPPPPRDAGTGRRKDSSGEEGR